MPSACHYQTDLPVPSWVNNLPATTNLPGAGFCWRQCLPFLHHWNLPSVPAVWRGLFSGRSRPPHQTVLFPANLLLPQHLNRQFVPNTDNLYQTWFLLLPYSLYHGQVLGFWVEGGCASLYTSFLGGIVPLCLLPTLLLYTDNCPFGGGEKNCTVNLVARPFTHYHNRLL